ncbi:hypothetical protein P7L78_26890 [Tistrella bauzanensis]|uniref:Uncharacterized protein n=1 Tax=Tistrella arctica TaxID=3133430 RepID=A0ABU9YGY1_9PROT
MSTELQATAERNRALYEALPQWKRALLERDRRQRDALRERDRQIASGDYAYNGAGA